MEKKSITKFVSGLAVGVGLGVLFAPKKGSETREDLKKMFDDLIEKTKNIDIEEIKDHINLQIEQIKAELEDLDKEKVIKIAKAKAKDIQKKAADLKEYAVKKGTPVLENAAESIRLKTIDVTKEVLNKLEKKS